jgi:hypothetical protein
LKASLRASNPITRAPVDLALALFRTDYVRLRPLTRASARQADTRRAAPARTPHGSRTEQGPAARPDAHAPTGHTGLSLCLHALSSFQRTDRQATLACTRSHSHGFRRQLQGNLLRLRLSRVLVKP